MNRKKVSIICTIFNEEDSIKVLLKSLTSQTIVPLEIIFCDGGSTDNTCTYITDYIEKNKDKNIILLIKNGNRSVGRNTAITASTAPLIAITDAGCIPEKNWLEELLKKHDESNCPVIAGYYKGIASSPFEEAVIPYALVMPDKVNPTTFLPATRSMLIEKKVWEKVSGFNESLSHNEDYAFAQSIRKSGFNIEFSKDAVVKWMPRKNIQEFWIMIERFAMGDIEAGLIRPKVLFIFLRYIILFLMIGFLLFFSSFQQALAVVFILFILYSGWAIQKNKKYVKHGWYWLPLLQYVSDFAVMKGSLRGTNRF